MIVVLAGNGDRWGAPTEEEEEVHDNSQVLSPQDQERLCCHCEKSGFGLGEGVPL